MKDKEFLTDAEIIANEVIDVIIDRMPDIIASIKSEIIKYQGKAIVQARMTEYMISFQTLVSSLQYLIYTFHIYHIIFN